ncbi:MAG TPA: multicopper oxidase domain-containing protein [Candidatus Binataceae bacterium]|nr:multicopper oxidase domain-containing protein [Candidatus Binataceae bacterium]
MRISRREFLKSSGLVAAALAMTPGSASLANNTPMVHVAPVIDPNSLAKFVDPLPLPFIARSIESRPSPGNSHLKVPYYRMEMRQLEVKAHRDLKPTRMWGYGPSSPGPTFETRSGEGVIVEWVNALPQKHLLPIDHSIHGADAKRPDVRTVVHLHGGRVPPDHDGYPDDWYVPGKSAAYFYPNEQDAAMLWYHDHAIGITRLNIFAGLFGAYMIRDQVEDALNLPSGKYEIPLIIYDRFFGPDGQLAYAVSGMPENQWMPEFFGSAMLVSGKIFPYLEVEPRRYRFRVVNVANSRFFHLSLSNGQGFHQIGSDLGLLSAPVPLTTVMVSPAERVDLIIDFAGHEGEQIVMKNDTVDVMQFRVAKSGSRETYALPAALRAVPRTPESQAIKTRLLSLNEYDDRKGNTMLMLLNETYWHQPITENPVIDTTEIWTLINLTEDAHPIHLHLVRFQVLDRRPFDAFKWSTTKTLVYAGPAVVPDANEAGWKDTVRANPLMATRIIVRFEGYTGRYVWHCHVLEHEDNEMMRPYEILPANGARASSVAPSEEWCKDGRAELVIK